MTNKELILKNLAVGKHVVVKGESHLFGVFSKFGDEYKWSGWRVGKGIALERIGAYSTTEEAFSEKDTFIEAFDFEYETFKPGDKVLVSKDAEKWLKKFGMHNPAIKEMYGKILKVKQNNATFITVSNEDETDYWNFPKQALSYAPDPIKKETIKIGDCEYDKEEFEKATKDLKPIK